MSNELWPIPRKLPRPFGICPPLDPFGTRPSHFIRCFRTLYWTCPFQAVVIYCRVSARDQNRRGNLKNQIEKMKRLMEPYGITVLGVFEECVSGWITDHKKRSKLVKAAELAVIHQVPLVAFSMDRFVRNPDYKNTAPGMLPMVKDFTELRELTNKVTLLTWLHPDMDPVEVRGEQTKLGMHIRGKLGGAAPKKTAGYKKAIRLKKQAKAIRIWKTGNWTMFEISQHLQVPKSTIRNWVSGT